VEWKYLKRLVEIQTQNGLRAANKLTIRHVNYESQKMKVKLCSQTLSNSVAVSLKVCKKLGMLEFAQSDATSEFIELMNRQF
jgi:hypothetical protein